MEKNDRVRLLYVLGERFDGIGAGAIWEDAEDFGLEHLRGWELMAVVTDVEWIGHTIKAVGWMIPAEVHVFPTSQLAAAEAWVAGDASRSEDFRRVARSRDHPATISVADLSFPADGTSCGDLRRAKCNNCDA